MKKAISVLLCLCLALSVFTVVPFAASAAETEQESVSATSGTTGDCTWTLDDNGVLTISGNGAMDDYSMFEGENVAPWNNITSVIINDGVTNIGRFAFRCRTSLTSVSIPDSVTSIGNNAFEGCTGLTSVVIPNNVTSIGNLAFAYCSGLTRVTMSDSVTSMNSNAFSGCQIQSVIIHINDMYNWCENENIVRINYGIPTDIYGNNKKVTDLVIPNGVTHISNYAFRNTSLTSLTIPDSVNSIGMNAFVNCTNLTSVTIPDSVTSIGASAFYGCSADLMIICNPGSAAEKYAINYGYKTSNQKFLYTILEDGTVEVTEYLDNKTDVVIPGTYKGKPVNSLKSWLFLNNPSITSVKIPNSVTQIDKGAFYSCVELKTVTMGNNVTEIGANAFEKCLYLENITLSNQLETIGDEAFYDCRRLKTLDIPATVTTIGEEAFTNCRSLTELVIPKGVQNLGNEESVGFGMFENCKNLKEITIPESVGYIQDNAFDGCGQVTIRAKVNSYAAQYAAANQLAFSKIDSELVGDANGDSKINIRDVTSIQRFVGEFVQFTDEQLAAADVDGNGIVDINDATYLQMYLAEYDVTLG